MTITSRLKKLEEATAVDKQLSCPIYDDETEQEAMAAAGITDDHTGLIILVRHWTNRPMAGFNEFQCCLFGRAAKHSANHPTIRRYRIGRQRHRLSLWDNHWGIHDLRPRGGCRDKGAFIGCSLVVDVLAALRIGRCAKAQAVGFAGCIVLNKTTLV